MCACFAQSAHLPKPKSMVWISGLNHTQSNRFCMHCHMDTSLRDFWQLLSRDSRRVLSPSSATSSPSPHRSSAMLRIACCWTASRLGPARPISQNPRGLKKLQKHDKLSRPWSRWILHASLLSQPFPAQAGRLPLRAHKSDVKQSLKGCRSSDQVHDVKLSHLEAL